MSTIARFVTAFAAMAVMTITARLARWLNIAERQVRQAQFEMQMYRGNYRHSSKNDDELPIVR
jgi:hypothetical protein